jgi:hypothetical protein
MIVTTYIVMCDVCGEEADAAAPSISEVRNHVAKLGWRRRTILLDGGSLRAADVCPLHDADQEPLYARALTAREGIR